MTIIFNFLLGFFTNYNYKYMSCDNKNTAIVVYRSMGGVLGDDTYEIRKEKYLIKNNSLGNIDEVK